MGLGNKEIMAKNIRRFMELNNVTPSDVCKILKFPAATFSDWINAKSYPRIDKIELLANYFGIAKSSLVEEPSVPNIPEILDYYNQLNDLGKHEATKRVEELTYINKYTEQSKIVSIRPELTVNAAHAIDGASPEDIQHDEDIMDDDNF